MKNTIKKHKDFDFGEDAFIAKNAWFIARARPGRGMYGIIAAKRTFRLAVNRNRAKRLIRAWAMAAGGLPLNMDFVFICRGAILQATLPEGKEAMKKAIKKCAICRAHTGP